MHNTNNECTASRLIHKTMRLLVLAATAACTAAFLPPLPLQQPQQRLPAAAANARPTARKAAAPLHMSSIFLDENALADRIKDGLLIRYLPEVRFVVWCGAVWFTPQARGLVLEPYVCVGWD